MAIFFNICAPRLVLLAVAWSQEKHLALLVTFRYNACNSALTALLDFPTLSLLFFWCGGLCAAHGIRRHSQSVQGVLNVHADF